ncbi:hypothetical protein [Paenibacillus sp. Y412MC10]|uniref:hypothetical protein n=1 Tax=Geobacillus sp. (strain Y412MC10) TaxID=481743 RepID=UPI0011AB511C|nr:hypothetical protein [Paenibacillus sp. Y412MC10]
MRQSEGDLQIVKRYLELPILLDVLEYDKRKLGSSKLNNQSFLVSSLESIQDKVTTDIYEVKKEMNKRSIKIIEQRRLEDRLVADYLCRNYKHKISLLWSKVKFDAEVTLAGYLGIDIYKLDKPPIL